MVVRNGLFEGHFERILDTDLLLIPSPQIEDSSDLDRDLR